MFSQTIIVGNLGAKPILRNTPNGTSVTTLRVAENRYQGPNHPEKTLWYSVELWGAAAEAACRLKDKGDQVMVIGKMKKARVFVDREGRNRAELELTAEPGGVIYLGKAPTATAIAAAATAIAGAAIPAALASAQSSEPLSTVVTETVERTPEQVTADVESMAISFS